ncbi:hypothetical protein KFE25_009184 [Diacronema lutheri]|uniref:TOG domain-containing protein n=4 Tax=Diacronema lutheri TaxID=2081491 RepID=A0A8J5XMA5_DIALT|nr:hypothetical protein KFE25_009184 [Diacronema lutheri]
MASPSVVASFEQLVRALMSGNNDQRGAAESAYNASKEQPDTLFACLVTLLRTSTDAEVRSMCAVLLRRTVSAQAPNTTDGTKLVARLSPPVLASFKQELLSAVEHEAERSIRRKVADAIGVLGRETVRNGSWPELFPFVLVATRAENANLHESALQIITELADTLANSFKAEHGTLKAVFAHALGNAHSAVRIAGFQALASFLLALDAASERAPFQELIPLMLQAISSALNSGAEDDARDGLEIFVEIADTQPKFLKKHVHALVHALVSVASAPSLEEATRHLAFECMLTLSESAPAMCRKIDGFAPAVIPLALHMMLELEGDTPDELDEWEKAAFGEDTSEISDYDVGSEALDRFAVALGGKLCLPIILEQVGQLAQSADWKRRHAALMAISQAGEGCSKQLSRQLGAVVAMVVANLADAHARVRWASVNTIGQMCTDFGPQLQETYHSQLLPALCAAMDDGSMRVQGHAASAIINFCEHTTRETLEPYLEALLGKLLLLLQRNVRHVQEQAVTAVASIADVADGSFAPFYDTFVPGLIAILSSAQGKEMHMLRGKAMECVSLIGLAVGREKFEPHAVAVMDAMLSSQVGGQLAPDDPQLSFMLQASARICKCLGDGFVPYLAHVVPPLLKSAQADPGLELTDADEGVENDDDEEADGRETVTVTIPGVGNKRISIRTSALEEKATACSMLTTYAQELRAGFFPYVREVASVLGELVSFEYMEDVRIAAGQALPELVRSAALAHEQDAAGATSELVQQLLHFALEKLTVQMADDPDVPTCGALTEVASSLVELSVEHASARLSDAQLAELCKTLAQLLGESFERRQEHEQALLADRTADDDDEDEEEVPADEETLLSQIVECIGQGLKAYHSPFLALLSSSILPRVQALLAPERSASDRTAAMCVFDDIIEHCSADGGSAPFVTLGTPVLIQYATDESASVRQAAVYGLGVLAQHAGAAFTDEQCRRACAALVAVVTAPTARDDDSESASDNAISALGKMMLHRADVLAASPSILDTWLSYLPLRADMDEAVIVHAQLCSLVERHGAALLGAHGERAPTLVRALVNVLTSPELSDQQTRQRATALLHAMRAQPAASAALAQLQLSEHESARLNAALSG